MMVDIDDLITEVETKYGAIDPGDHKILVVCPVCKKVGRVTVDKSLLQEKIDESGDKTVQFPITAGEVCDHHFMARLDAHFQMR